MKEVPNIPVTRYDLSCPDEQLREILGTIVCCTDCGFEFYLEEDDLVIKNKGCEYRVDISKYLHDTRVVDFKIEGLKLVLRQSDDTFFEVLLSDIINGIIYRGTHVTSSPGIQTEITIPHNLGFIPMFYTITVLSKEAEGFMYSTASANQFTLWYETAPKVGGSNLKYNWIVII